MNALCSLQIEGDVNMKALIGNNWVDPPKRERKRNALNYNESEYFKQVSCLPSTTCTPLHSIEHTPLRPECCCRLARDP